MTVAQLDRELGDNELPYWRAYLRRRPPREFSAWYMLAVLKRLLISIHTEKGKRLPDLSELMPDFDL